MARSSIKTCFRVASSAEHPAVSAAPVDKEDHSTLLVIFGVSASKMNAKLLKIEMDNLLNEREQTLKTLQQRNDVHNLFVEHAPAAIAICDKQMRYLANSARWAKDYDLEEGNLVGRCHYDLFPDLPQHWKEEHQRCFQGEIIPVLLGYKQTAN